MRVGPCIPVEVQLQKAEVGPTSGPTGRGVLTREAPGLAAPGDPGDRKRGPVGGHGDLQTDGGPYDCDQYDILKYQQED